MTHATTPPSVDQPGSSQRDFRAGEPITPSTNLEDLLGVAPSSDDLPTIISRNAPVAPTPPVVDSNQGIRGRRLAHFELLDPIGVGGMAAVIRARDTQLDRLVALKILPPDMAHEPENVRRFHQEARSAAKLDHENVARVFYCGEDQRLHFIAFEFVEGDNLRTILERRGKLPLGEVVHYLLQVAAGLAHAARRSVVHRDIKPSNIIITPTGRAKLVDMGLARSLEPRGEKDLTQSGVTLGTFDYISPEQALEPRDADTRSDIYSLGCTFYHLLTGQPVVPEGTAAKKLHHHQHIKPIDPREYVPDLPLEVVMILDRMMAKNPRDRFQSPEELVHRLLGVARKLGTTPEVAEGVLSMETSVPTDSRPNGPVLWVLGAILAVVALVLVLDPGSPTPPRSHGGTLDRRESKDTAGTGKVFPPQIGPEEKERPSVAQPPEEKAGFAVYAAPENPTVEHLLDWLQQNASAPRVELQLGDGVLNLTEAAKTAKSKVGLLLSGKDKVIIKPQDPAFKPVLVMDYGDQPSTDKPIGIRIESRETSIEGIHFRTDNTHARSTLMTLELGAGNHDIANCHFEQTNCSLDGDSGVQASVSLNPGSVRSTVSLRNCLFLGYKKRELEEEVDSDATHGGQTAILRQGAVNVTVQDCVFGPFRETFRIEGRGGDRSLFTVRRCSVMLPAKRSTVFDVRSPVTLDVNSSLFARANGESVTGAVLLRQLYPLHTVTWNGKNNRYYDMDGYWCMGDAWQEAGWLAFRRKLTAPSRDTDSRVLLQSPWRSSMSEKLESLISSTREAFVLNSKLKDSLQIKAAGREEWVGSGQFLRSFLTAEPSKTEMLGRRLVVEAESESDTLNGVYTTLRAASYASKPEDTILIRHEGELKVDPMQFNKPELASITIKAAPGFQPILTLEMVSEAETAMFKIFDGKLRLEGLHFRLESRTAKTGMAVQSVVSLSGDGDCVFKQCQITLKRTVDGSLSVATIPVVNSAMALEMAAPRERHQGPRITLENCFVRGEGQVVTSRANRPFEFQFLQSIAALSGSLVQMEATPEASLEKSEILLKATNSTMYLDGHLLKVQVTKDAKKLVPIKTVTEKCVLVPAKTGLSVFHFLAPEGEENLAQTKLSRVAEDCAYGNWEHLFNTETADVMARPMMDKEKWRTTKGEEVRKTDVKFATLPTGKRFWEFEKNHFTLTADLKDIGFSGKEQTGNE